MPIKINVIPDRQSWRWIVNDSFLAAQKQKHAIREHACRKKAAFYVRIKQYSNGAIAPCGQNGDSVVVYCEGIYVPAMRHAMTASYR